MNNLIERLRAYGTFGNCEKTLIDEAADTLLALQTRLSAAELKAKEWIDVAYEAASQKEELKRELERVERALVELVALKDLKDGFEAHFFQTGQHTPEHAAMRLDYEQRKPLAWKAARAALPSAKTATETE